METHDVAIIGAGLAGLQCARLLAREGVAVLLVDGRKSLDRSIHTTGIFVRKTLEDFALPEDCLGPAICQVVLYPPSRHPLELTSLRDEFRIGRMGRLYGRFLEQCLRGGVAWRPGARYLGCEPSGDGSLLRLECGGAHGWVRARYVVGADGARSLVAQDLGLDVNREWIVGVEEVLAGGTHPGAPRLRCFLDPVHAPGYLAWVAEDGEEAHVGVGGYPQRFDPLAALQSFRTGLAGIVDLEGATVVERRGGRIPVGGVLGRICNERGLLVGDAAGAPSPLTAGGLDPCMRLSEFAAAVITRYLATGDRQALGLYSGGRFRSRFMVRRWMRRLFSSMRSPAALEGAVTLLRTPLLRPLAGQLFFGRGSFPDVSRIPRPRLARLSSR